jgi:hypothetical protein
MGQVLTIRLVPRGELTGTKLELFSTRFKGLV